MSLDLYVSELIPDGRQVWARGSEVLKITDTERTEFFRQFGLTDIPLNANRVYLSQRDYDELRAKLTPTAAPRKPE